MINGSVGPRLEAVILVKVFGPTGQVREVTAEIDTGFNGALTLPVVTASALSLTPLAPKTVTLGDGSQKVVSIFDAEVLWDGQRRKVRVLCAEITPVIGTALLSGYHLGVDFVDGGVVAINAIP
jgi:clan AA aspartic protease